MKQRHKNHFKKQNQARIPRGISIGLAAITVVAGASLVVPHISQSFTDTSQTPPNGNVEAPINISGDDQWKEGNLGISTNSAPGAALDVGGNVNIESGNILATDDIYVRNATPVNGSRLLTDLIGNGGGSTPSLDVVLSEGNTSGGTDIQMTGNSTMTGVPAPTNGSDVATKNYVDAQAGGGSGGGSYLMATKEVEFGSKWGSVFPEGHCEPGFHLASSEIYISGSDDRLGQVSCVSTSNEGMLSPPGINFKIDDWVVLPPSVYSAQKSCSEKNMRLPTTSEVNRLESINATKHLDNRGEIAKMSENLPPPPSYTYDYTLNDYLISQGESGGLGLANPGENVGKYVLCVKDS